MMRPGDEIPPLPDSTADARSFVPPLASSASVSDAFDFIVKEKLQRLKETSIKTLILVDCRRLGGHVNFLLQHFPFSTFQDPNVDFAIIGFVGRDAADCLSYEAAKQLPYFSLVRAHTTAKAAVPVNVSAVAVLANHLLPPSVAIYIHCPTDYRPYVNEILPRLKQLSPIREINRLSAEEYLNKLVHFRERSPLLPLLAGTPFCPEIPAPSLLYHRGSPLFFQKEVVPFVFLIQKRFEELKEKNQVETLILVDGDNVNNFINMLEEIFTPSVCALTASEKFKFAVVAFYSKKSPSAHSIEGLPYFWFVRAAENTNDAADVDMIMFAALAHLTLSKATQFFLCSEDNFAFEASNLFNSDRKTNLLNKDEYTQLLKYYRTQMLAGRPVPPDSRPRQALAKQFRPGERFKELTKQLDEEYGVEGDSAPSFSAI